MNEAIGWIIYALACAVFAGMAMAKTEDESCGPQEGEVGT